MRVVADERDILAFAVQEARRCGDPDPALIQHTIGTREAATKTTGSWVRDDAASDLIAIKGRFSVRVGRSPGMPGDRTGEHMMLSVLVRVVNIATGRVTDCGGSDQFPDLAPVGPVVTDHPAHLRGVTQADRSPCAA